MMDGIHNFRDFGGYGTQDGRRVRGGMLYRSGSLSGATGNDLERLRALGIKTVCDLRTQRERAHHPNPLAHDAHFRYTHIPMKARQHDESGRFRQLLSLLFGKARTLRYEQVLEEIYREYVSEFREELGMILGIASDEDNLPILIHCTAGKDRTGLACAIIHHTLGVPYDTILSDYLLSNESLHGFREEMLKRLGMFSLVGISRERFQPLFEVRREYLEASFSEMREGFGSVNGYIRDGLGFSDEARGRLADLLLEPAG
ncbi:tyrosine-protein phosphatase, partial [Candidatus Fermentibacteria bacterium]|nr:tyrosine-protein phosphatase [Candidatus Fermentibacteria bacterium]